DPDTNRVWAYEGGNVRAAIPGARRYYSGPNCTGSTYTVPFPSNLTYSMARELPTQIRWVTTSTHVSYVTYQSRTPRCINDSGVLPNALRLTGFPFTDTPIELPFTLPLRLQPQPM